MYTVQNDEVFTDLIQCLGRGMLDFDPHSLP